MSEEQDPKFRNRRGPYGLGDPDDTFLRKVEIDILVPKLMRDKARTEKCVEEVAAFTECCKKSSFAMVVTCRKENKIMKDCLTKWYNDPEFQEECKQEYIDERRKYRLTGMSKRRRELIHELKEEIKQETQSAG